VKLRYHLHRMQDEKIIISEGNGRETSQEGDTAFS
jgi:hypothetical protein